MTHLEVNQARLTGSVINNGTVRLTNGALLQASGASSFVNNGILDLIGGAASLPPNFTNGSNGTVVSAGDVRVQGIARTGNALVLTIKSYSGHTYQLQRAAAVGGPYVNVDATQAGSTGSVLTFTHQETAGTTQGFYRVVVSSP